MLENFTLCRNYIDKNQKNGNSKNGVPEAVSVRLRVDLDKQVFSVSCTKTTMVGINRHNTELSEFYQNLQELCLKPQPFLR